MEFSVPRLAAQSTAWASVSLLVSACAVDTTGIPYRTNGHVWDVDCMVRYEGMEASGPEPQYVEVDFTVQTQYCARDGDTVDHNARQQAACQTRLDLLIPEITSHIQPDSLRSEVRGYANATQTASTCRDSTESGDVGSGSSGLISTPDSGTWMLHDPTGSGISDQPSASTLGKVTASSVMASAEFPLGWRHGRTQATGFTQMDWATCKDNEICGLVFRYASLDIEDFRIERPWPTRDIPVADTHLSTVSNHFAYVQPDGSFAFRGIKAVTEARIDGEEVHLLSDGEVEIEGKFSEFHNEDEKAGPRKIDLTVQGRLDSKLAVDASAILAVERFPAGLRLEVAPNCMTAKPPTAAEPNPMPKLGECGYQQRQHEWHFDKLDVDTYRVRQHPYNRCLYINPMDAKLPESPLHFAKCSDSRYQQWVLKSNGLVLNPATGKCLSAKPDPDLVLTNEVKAVSCPSKPWPSERWKLTNLRLPKPAY